MSEDDLMRYARTPEGRAQLDRIKALIPDIDSKTPQEVYEYMCEVLRAYRARTAN
jgi:hypothetical protein